MPDRASSQPHRPPPLPALTGLRFFAALGVVLIHTAPPTWRSGWGGALLGHAYLGASFFFVLSGFILTYNYVPGTSPVNRRAYAGSRFSRLYPMHALGVIAELYFVVSEFQALGTTALLGAIIAAATLTQAWFPDLVLAVNFPGWTLSNEAFFYLAFPFLVSPIRAMSWKRLAAAGAGIWLLAVCISGWALANFGWDYFRAAEGLANVFKYNPLIHFASFFTGVVAARFYLLFAVPAAGSPRAWQALAVFLVAALLLGLPMIPQSAALVLNNGLLAPFFGLFLFALACGRGALGDLLSRPALVFLGEASYALYVLHVPLSRWWYGLHGFGVVPGLDVPGAYLAYLAFTLLLACLAFRFFETPARRALQARFGIGRRPAGHLPVVP